MKSKSNRPVTHQIAAAAILVLLVWLVAYPLALVSLESFRTSGVPSLENYREFIRHPNEWRALWGSLWISVASVALSAAIGIPLAFLFSRYEFPGRRPLGALVALPAVLPPLVGVVAFLFLYGETGFAARLVEHVFHRREAPWRLEGPAAILLVHAYSMYVYFYLFTRAGLAAIDSSIVEASAALGAGSWRTNRRLVLPLLRPALTGAALLTFMTSLASFSAPYIFGGGFRVMTTQIVSTRLNGDYSMAMVETVSLTVVALLGLFAIERSGGRDRATGGKKGTAPRAKPIRSRFSRILVTVLSWSFAIVLLLPHATLLLLSFVPAGTWTVEAFPPQYTTRNYLSLFHEPERLRPLLNSLWMASGAMAAALALSFAAGLVVVRTSARGRRAIETLLALPWAVPGTVFAIALATLFGVSSPGTGRFVLIGTLWILPLAYLVRNLPITSRALLSGLRGLDSSHGEAAASLGAGPWRTLGRVTIPLLRPAIAAGATLAFVTGLGDFVTSIVLYTWDTRPMSLEILSSLRQSDVGAAAAFGVLLMILSAAVFALGSERTGAAS